MQNENFVLYALNLLFHTINKTNYTIFLDINVYLTKFLIYKINGRNQD